MRDDELTTVAMKPVQQISREESLAGIAARKAFLDRLATRDEASFQATTRWFATERARLAAR